MIYGEELLELLTELQPAAWRGEVYRHMFGSIPPGRENVVGARWNPPEIPAIYTSLAAETAKAEGDYYFTMQPLRITALRRLHRIAVSLATVLDLRDWQLLRRLGIEQQSFTLPEPLRCKEIGGGAAHLGCDGLLVPSARTDGTNLVIFPGNQGNEYDFSPIEFEIIA